jgi:hypothetical protein
MPRNALSEFRLRGARTAPDARPPFQPAVEALEERIVLSGAPLHGPAGTGKLAAINPTVAAQKVLGLLTASVQQFTSAQAQLVGLVVQMGTIPAGLGRLPLARRAVALINAFLRQEKTRFQKFQALARKVHGLDPFTSAAGLYESFHGSALGVSAQVAWIRALLFTTVTVPGPPSGEGRGAPRVATGGPERAALSPDVADDLLFVLTLLLANYEGTLQRIAASASSSLCAYGCQLHQSALSEVNTTLAPLEGLGKVLESAATDEGKKFFEEELATLNALTAAANAGIQQELSQGFKLTTFIPHHPPAL